MIYNKEPFTKHHLHFYRIYVFEPKSEAEAAFIQTRLFDLGCRWQDQNDQRVRHAREAVTGCILVDRHKNMRLNKSMIVGGDDHYLCTAAQLGQDAPVFSPEKPPHEEMIFYPRTKDEAELIQRCLIRRYGARNINGEAESYCCGASARYGLFFAGSVFGHGVTPAMAQRGQVFTLPDIHPHAEVPRMSDDASTAFGMFNELAARLAKIETRLDALEAEIAPPRLGKPALSPVRRGAP